VADDEIEINPRSPFEAGRRLIVLASLVRRLFLEDELARESLGNEAGEERFDLLAWLENSELGNEIESAERTLLSKPIGDFTPDDHWAISSQVEGYAVLGWYLNLIATLPGFESPDVLDELLTKVPQPWDAVGPWLDEVNARSLDELAAQRELAEIWLWRAEVEEEKVMASGRERTEINLAVRETAIEALNAGLVPELTDGDLPVGGKAFKALEMDEQEALGLIAYHRLRALNWLCGYGDSWSEAPLEI
jgi:hypothetical protein